MRSPCHTHIYAKWCAVPNTPLFSHTTLITWKTCVLNCRLVPSSRMHSQRQVRPATSYPHRRTAAVWGQAAQAVAFRKVEAYASTVVRLIIYVKHVVRVRLSVSLLSSLSGVYPNVTMDAIPFYPLKLTRTMLYSMRRYYLRQIISGNKAKNIYSHRYRFTFL